MAGTNGGVAKCGFIFLDTLAIALVVLPALLFRLPGFDLPVFQRGFFCSDETISYPYKDSTVPSTVLYAVGIGLYLVVMITTEIVIFAYRKRQDLDYLSPDTYNRCCGGLVIPPLLYQIIRYTAVFFFGLLVTMTTFDITKNVVGRLRPHFLDICQPDFNNLTCSEGPRQIYIMDDVCMPEDPKRMLEARRSFPSGHAAVAVYTMLFVVLYMQSRWSWRDTVFLRPLVQVIALFLALYTCLSRISDYKHHWSDVFGGAVMGGSIAAAMVWHLVYQISSGRAAPLTISQGAGGTTSSLWK
ncbi:phospholipid phosphatase 3-like isoform X2 [Lytechinus variegatus]|uniref:phospholipid phosphatase 3-like isoform X2 n=1 Tax=Lytechinus variegatus TaxID=7654 RepID=UPI001BB141F5|nr:phospholipid phosphatase 3-like isoform X2 [Lytechinus variegatus]